MITNGVMLTGSSTKSLRTLDSLPVDGKTVLVRVDFNVAVGSDARVDTAEDYRIEATLPTLQELQQRRCRVVLLTHFGEEEGGSAAWEPVHRRLEELLHEEVVPGRALYGNRVETQIHSLEPGGMLLLPNVRDDARELHPSETFGRQLASLAEAYVNEAFSASHRDHTSLTVLPKLLPSAAGRRTELEIATLQRLQTHVERPYVAIISGAKTSTKIDLLRQLVPRIDSLAVGGRIANVLLAARLRQGFGGQAAGSETDELVLAHELLASAGDKLLLPVDVVVGQDSGDGAQTIAVEELATSAQPVWDIGAKSVAAILTKCAGAKTVLWNGPVGRFEVPAYAVGTRQLAQGLAGQAAWRVVGGGDTVVEIEKAGLVEKFDHVSVGGGALVAYLEGKPLPGLVPLYG